MLISYWTPGENIKACVSAFLFILFIHDMNMKTSINTSNSYFVNVPDGVLVLKFMLTNVINNIS